MSESRRVVLRGEHGPDGTRHLDAALADNGDVVYTGQDLGDGVERIFGNGLREYEWELRIRAADTERAAAALGAAPGEDLLAVIERRGLNDVDARHELEAAEVPVEFWSRIGD